MINLGNRWPVRVLVNSDGLVPLVTVPLILPIADMQADMRWIRLRAKTGREQSQQNLPLFDHLIGAGEQRRRRCQTKSFCRLEIDSKLELVRLLNRKIGRVRTFEDAIDI